MRNEGWVPEEEAPEIEDCYIIAWLPEGLERKECFYAIASYESGDWDTSSMTEIKEYWKKVAGGIKIYAWRPLPEPYTREE